MEFDNITVHYGEIGLKGSNRGYFERLLISNMKAKLGSLADSITKETGQITVKLSKRADLKKVEDILSRIPGIANFSLAKKSKLDISSIKDDALEFVKDIDFETFKVDTARHDKSVKIDSQQLNKSLGEEIIKKYGKRQR